MVAAQWRNSCLLISAILLTGACGRSERWSVGVSSSALVSGNPVVSSVGYRADGTVTSRSLSDGAAVIMSQSHIASPAGVSTEEDRVGSALPEQHYRSDSLGRLQCVTTDATSTCPGSATTALPAGVRASAYYSSDKLTNLRRRLDGTTVNTRLEYDVLSANRPARIVVSKGDCATSPCETSFAIAYDARGNRTTETPSSGQGAGTVSRRFTYGPDNRLRKIRSASPAAPAADCSPTRWDQIDTDVGYDQWGILAFRRRRLGSTTQQTVRYSRTPSGEIGYSLQAGTTGAQRVTYKYLHLAGERTLAVRETWDGSQRTSRTYLFLHADRNGAPIAAFGVDHPDGQGTQQWTAERDPWGWTKVTSTLPTDEIPFEFPGQLRLDGTEVKRLVTGASGCEAQIIQPAIVSNGFRDYDPVAGIYLSRDPIALSGVGWAGSAANRNLYAYAGFNPIDRIDYWGLQTPGSDYANLALGFIPVLGPGLGMHDALARGDWAMALVNGGFLVLDLTTFGAGSLARAGTEGILSAGARLAEENAIAQTAAGVGRNSCEILGTRGAAEAGPKLLSAISSRVTNAANHVFGPNSLAKHGLEGVLGTFKGDAWAAFYSLENAAQALANQGAIRGMFEATVEVAGRNVTVRGTVIGGVARVSTAFIP